MYNWSYVFQFYRREKGYPQDLDTQTNCFRNLDEVPSYIKLPHRNRSKCERGLVYVMNNNLQLYIETNTRVKQYQYDL